MTPWAPRKPCNQPGCPALIPKGRYCDAHRRDRERQRGSAAARGYGHDHRAWAKQVLADHPACQDPDQRHPDRPEPSRAADHIVPLRAWAEDHDQADARLRAHLGPAADLLGDVLGPWSPLNGQGLCLPCHNAKSAAEGRDQRARESGQP